MKYILIFICVIVFPLTLRAQEKLNHLEAPTSPASSIIDLQPKAILSPKSYQALEASLYSSFINDYSPNIPKDFALEFTPYWASNHSLSLKEYLFPESTFDQFIRNSSFSIASTQNYILADSSTTNSLAFGYRTTFYLGSKKDREILIDFEKNSDEIRKVYSRIAIEAEKIGNEIEEKKSVIKDKESFLEAIKNIIYQNTYRVYKSFDKAAEVTDKIIYDCVELSPLDTTNPFKFIDQFKIIVDKNLKGDVVFNEYKSYIMQRQGLAIDIAYANFLNFPTNNFEFSIVPRQSLWITPAYRFRGKLDYLKLIGVVRYQWYNTYYYKKYFPSNQVYENNIEYGIAISNKFKKISIQFELVGRKSNSEIQVGTDSNGNELFRKEQSSDFQYIGSFNYNLTDQIVLSYSLGNRFEPIHNQNNTLVSLLTLNFGFGAPTKNNLDLVEI